MSTLIQKSRRMAAAEKALYHQESGAGKSRVTRPFFGLSPQDERWLEEELDQRVDLNIQRDGL